jgi:tRNA A-37 threonylcarbamoyl transferase component Bud32/Tol biopolymer transport system component
LALTTGSRLGPYEITAALGAGAMGEVYRAHDARLKRDVALKVLRAELVRDASRLARFEQEARAAASLNHPNIVAVFDVGVGESGPYVVSELLDGETLRTTLLRGALPHRTALDLATQVARGLAAAHQRGIVHRDLKPENIFITCDGRAKILDFGLAKLTEPREARQESHTIAAFETMPGTVLGTAGYMSPEQVRGEPADARTDIFAFGTVFYEMLSGRRAFGADTAVETMTGILRSDPPELPPAEVPPVLDRIVRRCLQKNSAQRFQSAGDLAFALEALASSSSVSSSAPSLAPAAVSSVAGEPPVWRRRWRPLALGAALLAGGVALGGLAVRRPSPVRAVPRFQARTFDRLPITSARFMPDGQTIVYSAASQGFVPELFVLNPNVEAPQRLGVSSAQLLAISSRGELALIVDARHLEQRLYSGTLARMTIGSSPRPVLDHVREADWSPDGASLAVVHDLGNGRDRLEYPVGTPLYEASGYLSDPRVSPDGSRVAFFEHQWRFDDRGWVKTVDRSGTVTALGGEFWGLQGLAWSRDGSSVVFSGSLAGGDVLQPMSVPATGSGAAAPVLGVPGRFVVHDVSADGRWLAVREDLSFGVRARVPSQVAERELSWLGSSGARALSADGQWLLMVDVGAGGGRDYGVVLRKTDGTQTIRLGEGNAQRLSPDGKWASAILSTPPRLVLYPTGAGEPIRVGGGAITSYGSADWFPDSARLLVCGSEASRAPRCYEQDLAGSPARPLTPEGADAWLAPDGRTLLVTLPDGSSQLSRTDGGPARPVTALRASDRRVAWSRDSRSIYVQRGLDVPAVVERVDLSSGERTLAARVAPEGLGAIAMIYVVDWVDDGRWYAYNYTSIPSTLFVVSGVLP